MISCSSIEKDVIRRHYDVSTFFYRLLWGRHIHHGLWDGNESPQQAAQQLTVRRFIWRALWSVGSRA